MPHPELKREIAKKLQDEVLRGNLGRYAEAYPVARAKAYENIDVEKLREAVRQMKTLAVDNIEMLADQFEAEATKRGAKFFRAATGEDVRKYLVNLCREKGVKRIVKSKSMASEEIHLNEALREAGMKVQETDLGEWIIQLAGHRPSHMVMPAIHLNRQQVADYFSKHLSEDIPPDIPFLVQTARKNLRQDFLEADLGISGANFGVAENGAIGIMTNEGNGRLTATLPHIHVIIIGYEKLIPKMTDAIPILMSLPRSATAQLMTSYVNLISGPVPAVLPNGEVGMKELHIILLDNGRLKLAKDPKFREMYQCVRCASCLNVCPVYQLVGGHVYGHIYAGGIGVLLTAFLNSEDAADKLQELCIGCRRCTEVCPGKIDIPGLISTLRARLVKKHGLPFIPKTLFRAVMANRTLFHTLLRLAPIGQAPFKSGQYIRHLPLFFAGLAKDRSLPAVAGKPFRDRVAGITRTIAKPKAKAAFFSGCAIDFIYPEIGEAVYKVLQEQNIAMVFPEGQSCCTTPIMSMGDLDTARTIAKQNIEAFESTNVDYIVCACPTCTDMLAHGYKRLFADEPEWKSRVEKIAAKVKEFSQLTTQLYAATGKLTPQASGPKTKVTYHDSCHMKRSLGIHGEPRQLINAAKGHELVEMNDADKCCGMGGSFGFKFPELSLPIAEQKIKNIRDTGAEVLAVSCPACMMQMKGTLDKKGINVTVKHVAEILAEEIK